MKRKIVKLLAASMIISAMSAPVCAQASQAGVKKGMPPTSATINSNAQKSTMKETGDNIAINGVNVTGDVTTSDYKKSVNQEEIKVGNGTYGMYIGPDGNIMADFPVEDLAKEQQQQNQTAQKDQNENKVTKKEDSILGQDLLNVLSNKINPDGFTKLDSSTYIIQNGDDLWIVSGRFKAKLEVLIYSEGDSSAIDEYMKGQAGQPNQTAKVTIPVLETENK